MASLEEVVNPGSYNNYLEQTQQSHSAEAIQGYSDKLHEYRVGRAALLGITLEELHLLPHQNEAPQEVSAAS